MGDAEIRRTELQRMLLNRAKKWKDRGTVLLIFAALMWCYVAWQLLMPDGGVCDGPLFEKQTYSDRTVAPCAVDRPWPRLLAALGLSVPVSLAGAVLYTRGSIGELMAYHTMALADGRR